MTEQEIENEIVGKNLNGPRITLDQINDAIKDDAYHVFPGTTVTVCLLTLANGFSVTGSSACISDENFDEELGKKISRNKAKAKIGTLLSFNLKEKLATG